MTKTNQDVRDYYQGDTLELDVTVTDSDGNPYSLLEADATWVLVREQGDTPRLTKTIGDGITITDAEAGELTVTIDSGETSDFLGDHYHELEIVDNNGREVIVMTGDFDILADST